MADIKEHNFNNRYPLSFVREDFKGVGDLNKRTMMVLYRSPEYQVVKV